MTGTALTMFEFYQRLMVDGIYFWAAAGLLLIFFDMFNIFDESDNKKEEKQVIVFLLHVALHIAGYFGFKTPFGWLALLYTCAVIFVLIYADALTDKAAAAAADKRKDIKTIYLNLLFIAIIVWTILCSGFTVTMLARFLIR